MKQPLGDALYTPYQVSQWMIKFFNEEQEYKNSKNNNNANADIMRALNKG